MGKGALTLGGLIFAIIALTHLGRIFCPFEVVIAGTVVPEWASYVGFIFFGMLSLYIFQARGCCPRSNIDQPPR